MADGMIRAEQSGTISNVLMEADDYLSADCELVRYLDMSKIYISVEVDQTEIANYQVGGSVMVIANGTRASGTISEVATSATQSRSASSVTYGVVVTVDNSRGTLSSGLSAYVILSEGSESGRTMPNMPDMNIPDMELPEGMNFPFGGQSGRKSEDEETAERSETEN